MNTWEKIPQINDKIKDIIEAADLGVELTTVIIGEKTRSSDFKPPLIWVYPTASPIDDESFALNEYWKLSYVIVAVVMNYNHDIGLKKAEELALRASAEFISGARDLGGLCSDTVRTRWVPAHSQSTTDDNIFGSGVEIQFRFQNREG